MNLNKVDSLSFNGLWEPVRTLKKETGVYNKNKVFYTLREYIYHPFAEESSAEISKNVEKIYFGRSFSLWDRFDNHHKCDLFQMNRVKVGDSINESNADEYIKKGWKKKPAETIVDDKEFYETYTNETYAPFDIRKMSPEYVDEISARHFDIEV